MLRSVVPVLRAWHGDTAKRSFPRSRLARNGCPRRRHPGRTGNRAPLSDAMRGRLLVYCSNTLNNRYLNKDDGVPSGIATEQVGDAPLRSGNRTRPGRRHSRQAGPVALDLAQAQCRTRSAVPRGGTRPRHGPQRPGARLSDPTSQFLLWDIPWHTSGLGHLKSFIMKYLEKFHGGGRGIRTPETLASPAVFKTAAFNHSAIPPSIFRLAAT